MPVVKKTGSSAVEGSKGTQNLMMCVDFALCPTHVPLKPSGEFRLWLLFFPGIYVRISYGVQNESFNELFMLARPKAERVVEMM